jgi:hypothetical protein
MKTPIDWISEWISGSLPAYPAAEVARTAESLGDTVLWSGPAATAASVASIVNAAAWAYMFYPLALIVVLASMHWFTVASRRHMARHANYELPFGLQICIGIAFSVGVMAGIVAFLRTDHLQVAAAGMQSRAFVVTPTRIVRLEGSERTDVPSSAVTGIRRLGDSTEVRLADGRLLMIEAMPTEHAALTGALDRVVETAGQGSRILKDRLG